MHKEGYGRLDLVFSDSPAGRCPECEGAGTGTYLWGDEEREGVCSNCDGTGECPDCQGEGCETCLS